MKINEQLKMSGKRMRVVEEYSVCLIKLQMEKTFFEIILAHLNIDNSSNKPSKFIENKPNRTLK